MWYIEYSTTVKTNDGALRFLLFQQTQGSLLDTVLGSEEKETIRDKTYPLLELLLEYKLVVISGLPQSKKL